MKKCNAEIMKMIKDLETKKAKLLDYQNRNSTTSYLEKEKPIPSTYSYDETKKEIDELDKEIRRLRGILNYANVTTMIDEFNISVNEALIYLAQLTGRLDRLSLMVSRNKISRVSLRNTNVAEYTVINYDLDTVKKDYQETRDLICKLQIAIDRSNLTNFIDC